MRKKMVAVARRGAKDDDGCTTLPSRALALLGKSLLGLSVREQPPLGKG